MNFTEKDVADVAALARLKFDDTKIAEMAVQMDKIVSYVQLIQDADVDGLEPFIYPSELSNVFRADEKQPSLPTEEVLSNCHKADEHFFYVPKVIE